jgi:hypothetical protein
MHAFPTVLILSLERCDETTHGEQRILFHPNVDISISDSTFISHWMFANGLGAYNGGILRALMNSLA